MTAVPPNQDGVGGAPSSAAPAIEPAPPSQEPGGAPPTEPSLRSRTVRAGLWVGGGDAAREAVRLVSNVILSALLMPQAFGVMALVNVFLQGLETFSDIGIRPSIIYSKRGEDQAFLNTAWTMQAGRGVVLWLASIALAWPFALLYGEPALAMYIPVAGLTAILAGFNSIGLHTSTRKLVLGRVTAIELSSQISGVVVMIVWALISRTVWALVGGAIATALVKLALSHILLPGAGHRFAWERNARRELFGFGRWITVSTALGYLGARGDRLLLGVLLPLDTLGIYTRALVFARAVPKLMHRMAQQILLPLYARLADRPTKRFKRNMLRARVVLMALTLPVQIGLILFGQIVVDVLYDARYSDAGWMLQALGVGMIPASLVMATVPVLLAKGDSFRHMVMTASRFVVLFTGILLGAKFAGPTGAILGVVAAPILHYPFVALAVRRYGVAFVWLDMIGFGLAAAGGAAVYLIRHAG